MRTSLRQWSAQLDTPIATNGEVISHASLARTYTETIHVQKTEHPDTHLGDSSSNTESDHLAHIIFHKEHKTDIPCKSAPISATENTFEKAPLFETASSLEKELAIPQTNTITPVSQQNEALIHQLTKEGSAPIYHEFYKILELTYPKLDVLQELMLCKRGCISTPISANHLSTLATL